MEGKNSEPRQHRVPGNAKPDQSAAEMRAAEMQYVWRVVRHIVIGLGALVAVIVAGYVIVTNSDAYRAAQRYIATHPRVIAVLGKGIETRLQWGGRFKVNLAESDRRMRLCLVATGKKASGTVTIELFRKSDAAWIVEHAELTSPEGDIVLQP
jgi:cytochrome oxidase complex assembly protein 1